MYALKGLWIDNVLLLLCVAVEGLLGESQFRDVGLAQKQLLEDLLKLETVVRATPVSEATSRRVLGSLNGMRSGNATDRFHALIEAGVLEEDDRKTWKKYRNAVAHGSFEVDPDEVQKNLDAAYRLTGIIYKLVFMRIGYIGVHTNFSIRGWRVDRFDAQAYQAKLDARATCGEPEPS